MMGRILIIAGIVGIALLGCQKYRYVDPIVPGGDRVVLLEEFTGKGCTNCPKGSREIDNLLAVYDSNLVVVSIHAGFFANPQFFPLGEHDLRTTEGEEIFSLLAPNIGYPSGVVDRVKVDGLYQISASQWAAIIAEEIQKDPAIEFSVDRVFNDELHNVKLSIVGRAKEDVNNELRVSIMITEDGIIDAQDDREAGGIVDEYEHKHVLRGMATAYNGDVFSNGLKLAESFNLEYEFNIGDDWVADNCEVIVFISRVAGPDNFPVLQAAKVGLTH